MSQALKQIEQIRQTIKMVEAVLITAGAGIGVYSGLPDFRGNELFMVIDLICTEKLFRTMV